MRVVKKNDGEVLTIFLEGNLDEKGGPLLDREIDGILSGEWKNIFFDMSKVNYISSIGVAVLIAAYKRAIKSGKKMLIGDISKRSREILEMVGVLHLFSAS